MNRRGFLARLGVAALVAPAVAVAATAPKGVAAIPADQMACSPAGRSMLAKEAQRLYESGLVSREQFTQFSRDFCEDSWSPAGHVHEVGPGTTTGVAVAPAEVEKLDAYEALRQRLRNRPIFGACDGCQNGLENEESIRASEDRSFDGMLLYQQRAALDDMDRLGVPYHEIAGAAATEALVDAQITYLRGLLSTRPRETYAEVSRLADDVHRDRWVERNRGLRERLYILQGQARDRLENFEAIQAAMIAKSSRVLYEGPAEPPRGSMACADLIANGLMWPDTYAETVAMYGPAMAIEHERAKLRGRVEAPTRKL